MCARVNYFNVEQIMTQDKEIVCAHTSLLSHYAINTYWLFLLAVRTLPWKWKATKKKSPLVERNKLSYHGRHYNTSWNPMIWACDKNEYLALPASFSINDKRPPKIRSFSALYFMTLDAFIFDKFTLEFIFMCYLHLIIIFATHLNYCLHYYIYICMYF